MILTRKREKRQIKDGVKAYKYTSIGRKNPFSSRRRQRNQRYSHNSSEHSKLATFWARRSVSFMLEDANVPIWKNGDGAKSA
jgi:hypothetical protein